MWYSHAAIGVLLASLLASEDAVRVTQTLTTQIRAESTHLPPGAIKWETRWVVIPEGCEYIKHDIELLQEFPELLPSDHRYIVDSIRRGGPGTTAVLGVSIGAHRSLFMDPGPASITVKLSVTASCEDRALEELKQKFGASALDLR